jgi:3-hydroxyisobutyrate dehydrogenase
VPRVGFVGLGRMGEPMAVHLQDSGHRLVVWNRSAPAAQRLASRGAVIARGPQDVLARSDITMLMLADADAIDTVLARRTRRFDETVCGRTIVHMGTTSPRYSAALAVDVRAAGGRYVEAPVSGSRVPAERGELVAMLGGRTEDVDEVEPLLRPMCRSTLRCGDVPSAMTTKLAVNVFLITLVTGLVESYHFARRHGVDVEVLRTAITSGQMASPIAAVKLDKLISRDLSAQAAIRDVHQNCRLITEAARTAATSTPLMDVCDALFAETTSAGLGHDDMAAVLTAIERRTARQAAREHRRARRGHGIPAPDAPS